MKPINGELIYTGGGIYVGIGQTDDGNWYMADHGNDAVRIVNANPNDAPNNGDDAWYPEWQDEHLVKDYRDGERDTVQFLYQSLDMASGNSAQKLKELLKQEYPADYFNE